MFEFANALTEKLSSMGNPVIILFVIVVVLIVLTIAFFGLRALNRMVDDNGPGGVRPDGQGDQGG